MTGALARIILRYVIGGMAGALVALGVLAPDVVARITTDKDLEMLIAMGLPFVAGVLVEAWYWAAKRFGWAT
jgi:hypothetical protein